MASGDARPVPIKNTAMRITFPLRDVNGDLVSGATGLDSEVSKDGGTFADCTNEATEIATSSGIYYLDLTSTEMNADTVAVIVKSSAKTFAIVMYPQEAGDMQVNVTYWNGTAVATPATAGIPDVNVKNIDNDAASASGTVTFPNATLASTTNITAGTLTTVTTATNVTTVNGLAANVITAASLATDAVAEIADGVWDEARAGHVAAGSFGEGVASVQGNVTGSVASVTGAVGSVTGAVGSVTGNVGGNVTGTVASVVGNVGGNVTGSVGSVVGAVGSVTGAVGSVTGNVGGNVVGSVASVTGAVGSVTGNVGGSVASIAANGVTASSLAADAVTEIATGVLTTAMTESYSTVGAEPTLAQAVYLMLQRVYNFNIFGTTITVTKLDGSTTAAQITINSATTPNTSERTA